MGVKYLACLGVFRAEKEKECSKNDGDATIEDEDPSPVGNVVYMNMSHPKTNQSTNERS